MRPLACVTALASANPLTAPTLFHSVCPSSCPLQCTCSPFLTENIFIVYECFIFKLHITFLLLNLTSFLTIQFLSYSSISFPSKLHICTLSHTPHPLSALNAACVWMDDWDPLLQDFLRRYLRNCPLWKANLGSWPSPSFWELTFDTPLPLRGTVGEKQGGSRVHKMQPGQGLVHAYVQLEQIGGLWG